MDVREIARPAHDQRVAGYVDGELRVAAEALDDLDRAGDAVAGRHAVAELDMLRPDAERDAVAGNRDGPARDDVAATGKAQQFAFARPRTLASKKVIDGEPMKPATKRLAGVW